MKQEQKKADHILSLSIFIVLIVVLVGLASYSIGYDEGRETYVNHFKEMQVLYSECVLSNTERFVEWTGKYVSLFKEYRECKETK